MPFVPQVVARADIAVRPVLGSVANRKLVGRVGAGATYLYRRPIPFGELGTDVALLDAVAGARLDEVELKLECWNLLDAEWNDGEFVYASNFQRGERELPDPGAPHHGGRAAHRCCFRWRSTSEVMPMKHRLILGLQRGVLRGAARAGFARRVRGRGRNHVRQTRRARRARRGRGALVHQRLRLERHDRPRAGLDRPAQLPRGRRVVARRWWAIREAHAHPGHYEAGGTIGEMLTPTSVDLVQGVTDLGTGPGITGTALSARFSFQAPPEGRLRRRARGARRDRRG